jgi:hypothetical protein
VEAGGEADEDLRRARGDEPVDERLRELPVDLIAPTGARSQPSSRG